jgi:ribosomal protein L11 methyltransferase
MAADRLSREGRYDLILANILAQPLIAMSTKLARMLNPRGTIVLSGLLSHQAGALVATYSGKGLSLERRIPIGEWVTLVMRRRS